MLVSALRLLSCVVVLLTLVTPHRMAYAQEDLMRSYTESEKAAFAFYRLTDTLPDFRTWITPTQAYKDAKPSLRNDVVQQGTLRLQQGFLNFYVERTPLTIKSPATLQLFDATEAEGKTPASERKMVLTLPAMGDPLYFPFNVGDLWLGVIVTGVKPTMSFPLDQAKYDRIKSLLRIRTSADKRLVRAEIVAFVKEADGKAPMEISGVPIFPMVASPVVLALWKEDEEDILLWEDVSPGYVTSRERDLMLLFSKE
ncbi:hypothetical protein [Micavibrio aeruginosavorus]|uniref:hypothetical protein n=1 Tax=Micavibrio aeruginosavorus TaxID=349221 RepID=UPI003F4AAB2B